MRDGLEAILSPATLKCPQLETTPDWNTQFLTILVSEGKSLEEAVRYGNASGALATTKFGAQPSLPTADEVEQLLKESPR